MAVISLILAVLLDNWLGEPKKYHPLVWFGRRVDQIETQLRVAQQSAHQQRFFGLIGVVILIVPLSVVVHYLTQSYISNLILSPLILYLCIAHHSLKQHALAVFDALDNHDLTLARQRVGWIVSRQTDHINEIQIQQATIESVLENGADAIFAPIFWFMVAGVEGVVLYRLSNTLDAMWGYKNSRYLYFGWAAARFDDVLNWIPARLTAISYAVLGCTRLAFSCWKHQANLLESPNAGVVMTAGAGALDLQLGGDAWYHGQLKSKIEFGTDRLPTKQSIQIANQLITHSLYLWLIIISLGAWFA